MRTAGHQRRRPHPVRQPGVRLRAARGPARLRRARRAHRAGRGAPAARRPAEDRVAGAQSRWPGRVRDVVRRPDGRDPGRRPVRRRRVRPARGRGQHPADRLPQRRGVGRRAGRRRLRHLAGRRRAGRSPQPAGGGELRAALGRRRRAGQRRHPGGRQGPGHPAGRARRPAAHLPRLLLRHADRRQLRRAVPGQRPGAGARRGGGSERERRGQQRRPDGRLPAGVRRLRGRLRAPPVLPAGYRPGARHGRVPGPGPAADRPAGAGAGLAPRTLSNSDAVTAVFAALYNSQRLAGAVHGARRAARR